MRTDKAISILEGKYESESEKWLKDQRDYTDIDFDGLYANQGGI